MVIVAGRGADVGGLFHLVHPGASHAGRLLRGRRKPRRPGGRHGTRHGPVRGGVGDAIANAPYHRRARAGLPFLAHGGHAGVDDYCLHSRPGRRSQRGRRAPWSTAGRPAARSVRTRATQRWHPHAGPCHYRPGHGHCGHSLHVRSASWRAASTAPSLPAAHHRTPGLDRGEILARVRGHRQHGLRVPAHCRSRRSSLGRDGLGHPRRPLLALAYARYRPMDPRGRHRWGQCTRASQLFYPAHRAVGPRRRIYRRRRLWPAL